MDCMWQISSLKKCNLYQKDLAFDKVFFGVDKINNSSSKAHFMQAFQEQTEVEAGHECLEGYWRKINSAWGFSLAKPSFSKLFCHHINGIYCFSTVFVF